MPETALIIDDEADIRELIAITLTRMGWDFYAAANLEEARNLLGLHAFDLCLTDMRLPDGNGVDFVKYAQKHKPHIPIAVITAHGNMEAAVDAMKNGAYDFVSKPVDISQLRQLVTQAIELKAHADSTANETIPLAPRPSSSSTMQSVPTGTNTKAASETLTNTWLVGESSLMQELQGLIQKVSRTNAPVWITGESGTGKEVIARSIHEHGPRSHEPFVVVNCGAIPNNLMESELFGHRKGSFTGATDNYDGLLMQANGGTLFLDEVEALPLQVQVKLLRAIQERFIRSVGNHEDQLLNVRILSASHVDLAKEVDAGRFRHDLYYRLNVITLQAPSLRDRPSDIALLVHNLLAQFERTQGMASISIDQEALDILNTYNYPGNVRELESILERASTLMDNCIIKACNIDLPESNKLDNKLPTSATASQHADNSEYQSIVDALNKTHWNRKAAAEHLGLTYRQLRYRIQQLDIDKAV